MNALAVIVNLILPGIGLVLVGKRLAGVVFAVVFWLAVDGMVLSLILIGGRAAGDFVLAFLFLAVSVWIWSLVRLVLHVVFLRSPSLLEHKDTLFRTGMEHYLKNQLAEAKSAFTQLLALDGADADAHLYLGLVYKNLDQRARARASFRRCMRYDYDRQWRWEVRTELSRLKGEC
jgi:tetratricopeptide (TPR) repeat protein